MSIPMTQKKLREARFFLQHLQRVGPQPVRNDPEHFDFFMSAFLSAARSVTFALHNEQTRHYGEWFPSWLDRRSEEDRSLLGFMKKQRNVAQKKGEVQLETEFEYVPISRLERNNGYDFYFAGPPGTPEPLIGVPRQSFFGNSDSAILRCECYIVLLEELVAEFVRDRLGAA